jgi:hypothetical protein
MTANKRITRMAGSVPATVFQVSPPTIPPFAQSSHSRSFPSPFTTNERITRMAGSVPATVFQVSPPTIPLFAQSSHSRSFPSPFTTNEWKTRMAGGPIASVYQSSLPTIPLFAQSSHSRSCPTARSAAGRSAVPSLPPPDRPGAPVCRCARPAVRPASPPGR